MPMKSARPETMTPTPRGKRRLPTKKEIQYDQEHGGENASCYVLKPHEHAGSTVDCIANGGHLSRAMRVSLHIAIGDIDCRQADNPEEQRYKSIQAH
jgi:hypothetical protein